MSDIPAAERAALTRLLTRYGSAWAIQFHAGGVRAVRRTGGKPVYAADAEAMGAILGDLAVPGRD